MGCFYSRRNENENLVYDMSPIRHLPLIFVNGVPGAGNQTVAESISDITGYTIIRPGELVRAEADKDTARGRLIADKLQAHQDIPEQMMVDMIKENMLMHRDAKGFILVGFPRSARLFSIFNRQVKCPERIVALEVDYEVAAIRLQNKLSQLGKPESEINAVRQVVKDAASKVKSVHKRFGGNVVTVNSSDNPNALASALKDILSDMVEESQKESEVKPNEVLAPVVLPSTPNPAQEIEAPS